MDRTSLGHLEAEVDAFLPGARKDGRFSIAETGGLTVALHAVTRSPAAEALSAPLRRSSVCAPT